MEPSQGQEWGQNGRKVDKTAKMAVNVVLEGGYYCRHRIIYNGFIDRINPFGIFSTVERPPECHDRISEMWLSDSKTT